MATGITLAEVKNKASRLERTLERYKESAQHAARVGNGALLTVAGGAAAGALGAKLPYVPGTTFPTPAAAGLMGLVAAMSGKMGDQGDTIAAVSAGMLAAVVARETEKLLSQ